MNIFVFYQLLSLQFPPEKKAKSARWENNSLEQTAESVDLYMGIKWSLRSVKLGTSKNITKTITFCCHSFQGVLFVAVVNLLIGSPRMYLGNLWLVTLLTYTYMMRMRMGRQWRGPYTASKQGVACRMNVMAEKRDKREGETWKEIGRAFIESQNIHIVQKAIGISMVQFRLKISILHNHKLKITDLFLYQSSHTHQLRIWLYTNGSHNSLK